MKLIGNERPVPNHFIVPWHVSARSWSPAVAVVSGEGLHVTTLANVLPLTTSTRIIDAKHVIDTLANGSPIYSFCFSRLRSLFGCCSGREVCSWLCGCSWRENSVCHAWQCGQLLLFLLFLCYQMQVEQRAPCARPVSLRLVQG